MFDVEKVADALLKIVSEPIKRLAQRVKYLEDRKYPDEKEIVDTVMSGMEPTLVELGNQLEAMKTKLLADVLEVRKIVEGLPEVDEKKMLADIRERCREDIEVLSKQLDEGLRSIEIPKLPEIELPNFAAMIEEAIKSLDLKDGHSPTIEEVTPVLEQLVARAVAPLRPIIDEEVRKAVATIPQAKDGVGLAGAVIDRNNHLVITLTDGTPRDLGPVVGKDADMDVIAKTIQSLVDALPKPRDGFGFEDMSVEYDGRRSFTLKFARAQDSKEFTFKTPTIIYEGVFKPDHVYERGDMVTWAGAMWHCDVDSTSKKPGENEDWTLAVKRGRNGKEVVSSEPKKPVVKV